MSHRGQILPFYILVDTSTSMRGSRISAVNDALVALHRTLATDPVITAKVRLSVMSFNTEARTDLPLSDLSDVVSMPTLRAGGQTRYGLGLEHVHQAILNDVGQLKALDYGVFRPCIFFISDGRPGGAWRTRRDHIVDKKLNAFAPNVVAYGVVNADMANLKRLATRYAMLAHPDVDAGTALKEVFRSITDSVVASVRAMTPQLLIRPTEGMILFDKEAE